jgi:MFS family permease
MIGFSLAGPILNFFGINAAFLIGAVSLVLAFIVAQFLPEIKTKVADKYASFFSERSAHRVVHITVEEGRLSLDFIRSKPAVAFSLFLLASVQGIIGVLAVVMSSYMEKVLKIHATDASYFLMIPLGLGMILGAYAIGRFATNIPRRYLVIPAILITGVLFMVTGLIPSLAYYFQASELPARLLHPRYFFRAPSLATSFAIAAFFLGVAAVSIIIPSQTVLQENTTESVRGKIFAVLGVTMNVTSIVPIILAGILSDLFGPAPIFFGMGLLVFAFGFVAKNPSVFFHEHHLPLRLRQFLGMGHWEK